MQLYKSRANEEEDIRNACQCQYEIEGTTEQPEGLTIRQSIWWQRQVRQIKQGNNNLDCLSRAAGLLK